MTSIATKTASNGTNVITSFFPENEEKRQIPSIETAEVSADGKKATEVKTEVKPEVKTETKADKPTETVPQKPKTEAKAEVKKAPAKPKAAPKNTKKVDMAKIEADKAKEVEKKAKVKAKQEAKAVKVAAKKAPKLQAKDKKITDYTLADARSRMRDANKESKSLSGALKIILSFWNEGYKDAFAAIGLVHKDLTVPNIQKNWSADLKVDGVFAYKTKVAKFAKSTTGDRVFEYDADGNKIYDIVLKEFNNNFSPIRIFDAMYYAQYAKGKTIFQKNETKAA